MNQIFGGYTTKTWNNKVEIVTDNDAFLFSITNKTKYEIKTGSPQAIQCTSSYGPTFGARYNFDLYIASGCN
jgi:hypothetical protein